MVYGGPVSVSGQAHPQRRTQIGVGRNSLRAVRNHTTSKSLQAISIEADAKTLS